MNNKKMESLNLARENEVKFNVILETLDSIEHINSQLTRIEQLNDAAVNDKDLLSLIEVSAELSSCLEDPTLRGDNYKELSNQASELETIVNLSANLDLCIDDTSKYDEAMNLIERIDFLHKEYGHEIPIIEDLWRRTDKQREYLVVSLCNRLENLDNSNKDEAFSVVNYLRRCGCFTDHELRLKYLQARDNWFNNCCEEQSTSFDNVVSVHSNGLPMIFNEYKSIFCQSSNFYNEKLMKTTSMDSGEDAAIINSWLLLKASIFVVSLEVYLKSIHQSGSQTPTMISDTMQKCFQLTGWLASIGFDFSSQLNPLFLKALSDEVKSSVEKATIKFETAFTTTISKSIESLLLPVDDEILRISNMKSEEQFPKSIEHYPIFRVYCLYIIDSLRWLNTTKSTLSSISLCIETYESLNASLTRVMKALSLVLNTDNNYSHPILTKIAISMITEVLPFIMNLCERLFPEKVILNAIGLTKAESKSIYLHEPDRLKNFRLDLKQIADPLKGTMPVLMQAIENQ